MELLLAPARANDFTVERSQRSTWAGSKSDCAALPPAAASCEGRCFETFERGRECDCDADCERYGKCCPDYAKHCKEGKTFLHHCLSKIYLNRDALLYHKQNCVGFSNNWTKENRTKITKSNFANKLSNFSSMNTLWAHTGRYPGSHHQDVNSEGKVAFCIRLFWH